jgi:hypothetical protein
MQKIGSDQDHEAASTSGPLQRRSREKADAAVLQGLLSQHLTGYSVRCGENLLYKIEVEATGKITHEATNPPMRGQYAFQTDILIRKNGTPLVAIELKSGSFSSHDIITYSAKAERHKRVYPYLRYGFIVTRSEGLGRRFVMHNEGFDFAAALPDGPVDEASLLSIIRRQTESAERLIALTSSRRLNLWSYEQVIAADLQGRG